MTTTYKPVLLNGEIVNYQREDGWFIGTDPLNADYARYLREVEAGTVVMLDPDPEPEAEPDRLAALADLLVTRGVLEKADLSEDLQAAVDAAQVAKR